VEEEPPQLRRRGGKIQVVGLDVVEQAELGVIDQAPIVDLAASRRAALGAWDAIKTEARR